MTGGLLRKLVLVLLCASASAGARPDSSRAPRIQIRVNGDEAKAVLDILAKRASGQAIQDDDWSRLFRTEAYVQLKQREAGLDRAFTDDAFKEFLLSPELTARAAELRRTLDEWKRADLAGDAGRLLPYLPDEAVIRAEVYLVIKPRTNSFVFEPDTHPAIFLYLDPAPSKEKFENTVLHELHHIGYASVGSRAESRAGGLSPKLRPVLEWAGAFGEGFAMLAAAGGPEVHPHAFSSAEERARWDRDMGRFNRDLRKIEKFFLDVLRGRLKTREEVDRVGFSFFGEQGPWYTVGYRMAVAIERQEGRARLIECMSDVRRLLPAYNRVAAARNAATRGKLALWSAELIDAIESNKP